MSFASAFAPARAASSRLLRGSTLGNMAYGLAVLLGGGVMGALYHVTNQEAQTSVQNWRNRRHYIARRHEAVLIRILGGNLHPALQEKLLHSRDAFRMCLEMLADPQIRPEDKACIRQSFQAVSIEDDE